MSSVRHALTSKAAAAAVLLFIFLVLAFVALPHSHSYDPTLAQGQSGQYTITISSTNGYSGSVALSATNVPQGVAVSFNPDSLSVTPSQSAVSTMTVSVSQGAAPGSYLFAVVGKGSNGQTVQATTFTLVIEGSVFLSINPTSGSVSAGNSIQTTATISGGLQQVTMSVVSGLPSGASASWQQNPITDSQSGVIDALTISTSANTPTGTYLVTINGTGADSQNQSVTYTLTVTSTKFTLQFNQDPLPQGTNWCATLVTVTQQCATVSSAGTSMVTFTNLLAGVYSWSAPPTVTSNGVQYSANVSSGSVTLSTSLSMSQTISYSISAYYLTMNVSSGGGSVSPSSSGWYAPGSKVTLSATPNSGYSFGSWSGTGSGYYSGTSSSSTITMNGPITETASFQQSMGSVTFSANIGSDALGSLVTIDGSSYSSLPRIFPLTIGSTHSFAWPSIIACGTGCQYVWVSTSGLSTSQSGNITVPIGVASVVATYQKQYFLSIDSPVGSMTGSGWYNAGSVADYGASPSTVSSGNTQYQFYEFSPSGSTNDPITSPVGSVTMNAPVTETASWTVWQYEQYSSTTPGYYTYSDYYTYSCASGEQLVGTECETSNTWYTCPSGYTLEGSTCTEQVTTPGYWEYELVSDTVWNPGYYSCSSGWSLSGSACSMTSPGYWTQVTTSYTTTSWVDTGSYEVWVDTGGYWTYQTVQDYLCFWSLNAETVDPQQVCIPWGTTTVATWVETGYWETVDTGYWLTMTTYVTTNVWNPGQTVTEGATWNPGYWSTTYSYELAWINPVTTTYTANPVLNTSVTYSAATATLNTVETWNPPVTNTYWAWTDTGTVV